MEDLVLGSSATMEERVEAAATSRGRRRLYIVLHKNVAVAGRLGPESPS
jgi:hypothetical protein